jgi:hypothetical protein
VIGDPRSASVWSALTQRGSLLGGSVRGLSFTKAHECSTPAQSTSLNAGCVWNVRADMRALLGGTTSARVLTVAPERHPELARILDAFEREHGIPLLVHAPLALPGEPPVAHLGDARRVFLSSEIDGLVLDGVVEEKAARRAQIEARRVVNAHAASDAESDTGIDALWRACVCTGTKETARGAPATRSPGRRHPAPVPAVRPHEATNRAREGFTKSTCSRTTTSGRSAADGEAAPRRVRATTVRAVPSTRACSGRFGTGQLSNFPARVARSSARTCA